MDSICKYDALLGGIALMIIPMIMGIFLGTAITISGALVAMLLVGVGMFVIPPTNQKVKVDSTRTTEYGVRGNHTQADRTMERGDAPLDY